MELSVIISSSNHDSNCLNKVLTGFAMQRFRDFEIIITGMEPADERRRLIQPFQKEFKSLTYLESSTEQNKATLLNKAIQASKSEYLVFTESNCIPRKDFLEIHHQRREETFFLSGGQFKLAPHIHQGMQEKHIQEQICFECSWLRRQGLKFSLKNQQLSRNRIKSNIMNALLPGKASWNHHNVSCWKKDLLDINGFDEHIAQIDQARDLCQRLHNNDIRGIKVHFNAICLHLNRQAAESQMRSPLRPAALKPIRSGDPVWTQYGIYKGRTVPVPYAEVDKG